MSGSRGRRESTTRSNTRTTSRSVAIATLMSPFATIVAGTMEFGPKRLQRRRR